MDFQPVRLRSICVTKHLMCVTVLFSILCVLIKSNITYEEVGIQFIRLSDQSFAGRFVRGSPCQGVVQLHPQGHLPHPERRGGRGEVCRARKNSQSLRDHGQQETQAQPGSISHKTQF